MNMMKRMNLLPGALLCLLLFSCAETKIASSSEELPFSNYGAASLQFVYDSYDSIDDLVSDLESITMEGHTVEWAIPNLSLAGAPSAHWELVIELDVLKHHCTPDEGHPSENALLRFRWDLDVGDYSLSLSGTVHELRPGALPPRAEFSALWSVYPSYEDKDLSKEHSVLYSFNFESGGQTINASYGNVSIQKGEDFDQTEAVEASADLLSPCFQNAILVC